jgi:hypothetical protein
MGIYSRLGLNFDTTRFGSAQTLSSDAANSLNLMANTSPLSAWQKTDLAAGSVSRTNYYQNPTASNVNSMMISANTIFYSSNSANDFTTSALASTLILELNNFKSHTDNISGVTVSTTYGVPSLDSAQNMGQLNMNLLAKTDGVSNTAPILGSFTSLFISDILQANTIKLIYYANEYANSVGLNVTTGNTSSNLAPAEIANIQNYLITTQSVLYNQRIQDCTFFLNSLQTSQDTGFIQSFNNMGGTMSYLVNNVIGTPSLLTKLNSSS